MKPLTDQEIVTALEAEMRNDLAAYTTPGEIVYSVTQKEILAFARTLGVPIPEGGPGKLDTTHDIQMRELRAELVWLQADLSEVNKILAGRTEKDDPIGHMQFSQRRASLQQQIIAMNAKIAALALEAIQQ
jgi:hypothetical protein